MKRIISRLVTLIVACSITAQGQTVTGGQSQFTATSQDSSKPAEKAGGEGRLYSGYVLVSTLFDSNIDHDENPLRSSGLVMALGSHFQNRSSHPSFEIDYEVARHAFSRTDRWDRVSHNLGATFTRPLTHRLSLKTGAEVSIKGSSEDRDLANEYTLSEHARYRITSRNWLDVYAAFRLKRYDDRTRDSVAPFAGVRFGHRFDEARSLVIGYKYEDSNARDASRSYVRRSVSAEYTTPLLGHDRLIMEVKYKPQSYARLVKVGSGLVPRRDNRWVMEAAWERPLAERFELQLSYRFESRSSNDLTKDFSAHLVGAAIKYRW